MLQWGGWLGWNVLAAERRVASRRFLLWPAGRARLCSSLGLFALPRDKPPHCTPIPLHACPSPQGLRTLEYCFARAVEQADLPLHVWSGLLVQEVQAREGRDDGTGGGGAGLRCPHAAMQRKPEPAKPANQQPCLREQCDDCGKDTPSAASSLSRCPCCHATLPMLQGGLGIRLVARTQLALTRGFAALPALARPLVSWSFRKLSGEGVATGDGQGLGMCWLRQRRLPACPANQQQTVDCPSPRACLPLSSCPGLLRRVLGCHMLASCEAAVEYWLALERAAQLPLAAAGAQQAEQLRVRARRAGGRRRGRVGAGMPTRRASALRALAAGSPSVCCQLKVPTDPCRTPTVLWRRPSSPAARGGGGG